MAGSEPSSQAFSPRADARARLWLLLGASSLVALLGAWYLWYRNSAYGDYGYRVEQPIEFSHRHHSGELGIDCRYCHQNAAQGPVAGMPSSTVCWSCHSQIYTESPMLEPLRKSIATGQPIRWQRVTTVSDVVYFNHAAHVVQGISCHQCHGDVADMGLTYQAEELSMKWCLECHRNPDKETRADLPDYATLSAPAAPLPEAKASASVPERHPDVGNLTDCYICHR